MMVYTWSTALMEKYWQIVTVGTVLGRIGKSCRARKGKHAAQAVTRTRENIDTREEGEASCAQDATSGLLACPTGGWLDSEEPD